jgi:aerobic-type carbon monoxide dehydrogenase small subunit (CoxS/CutS family)
MESEITRIEINVNGTSLFVDTRPGEMLVDVLRNAVHVQFWLIES